MFSFTATRKKNPFRVPCTLFLNLPIIIFWRGFAILFSNMNSTSDPKCSWQYASRSLHGIFLPSFWRAVLCSQSCLFCSTDRCDAIAASSYRWLRLSMPKLTKTQPRRKKILPSARTLETPAYYLEIPHKESNLGANPKRTENLPFRAKSLLEISCLSRVPMYCS
jgi:hypothetical protein